MLISSVGERDYSAQKTCHLLLQLPMFKASWDFVILSLDGSRAVDRSALGRRPTSNKIVSTWPLCLSACYFPLSECDAAVFCSKLHHALSHPRGERKSFSSSGHTAPLTLMVPNMSNTVNRSSCFSYLFAIRVNCLATTPPSLLPMPTSSYLAASHHR